MGKPDLIAYEFMDGKRIERKKIIAIDFDGVIHKYSKGYKDGSIYDKPIAGALEGLTKLYNRGYKIVIFTARENIAEVGHWITDQYDKVFPDLKMPAFEVTNTKPKAIAYIDDRGIRFTNWKDVLNYF